MKGAGKMPENRPYRVTHVRRVVVNPKDAKWTAHCNKVKKLGLLVCRQHHEHFNGHFGVFFNTHLFMYDLDQMIGRRPSRKANGQFAKGHPSPNKGKKWNEWLTPEQQAHIRAVMPHYGVIGIHAPNAGRPKVAVLASKDGKEFWFASIAEAGRGLNLPAPNIRRCLLGKSHTCGGWRFKRSYQTQH